MPQLVSLMLCDGAADHHLVRPPPRPAPPLPRFPSLSDHSLSFRPFSATAHAAGADRRRISLSSLASLSGASQTALSDLYSDSAMLTADAVLSLQSLNALRYLHLGGATRAGLDAALAIGSPVRRRRRRPPTARADLCAQLRRLRALDFRYEHNALFADDQYVAKVRWRASCCATLRSRRDSSAPACRCSIW